MSESCNCGYDCASHNNMFVPNPHIRPRDRNLTLIVVGAISLLPLLFMGMCVAAIA